MRFSGNKRVVEIVDKHTGSPAKPMTCQSLLNQSTHEERTSMEAQPCSRPDNQLDLSDHRPMDHNRQGRETAQNTQPYNQGMSNEGQRPREQMSNYRDEKSNRSGQFGNNRHSDYSNEGRPDSNRTDFSQEKRQERYLSVYNCAKVAFALKAKFYSKYGIFFFLHSYLHSFSPKNDTINFTLSYHLGKILFLDEISKTVM